MSMCGAATFMSILVGISSSVVTPSIRSESDGSLRFTVDDGKDFAFATGDTVTTVGELSDAAAKLRRDVECSKADSHAFATSAAELAADLNTAVAEIFAEALRNMSASQVEASVRIGSISASEAQVIGFLPECPATGCEALKHTIVAVVESGKEQPLITGVPIYICHFESEALSTAIRFQTISEDGHTVRCQVPYFDSTQIKDGKKSWKARIKLLAGLRKEILYIDQEHLGDTEITIASSGPRIDFIDDVELQLDELEVDDNGKLFHALLIEVADPDSPTKELNFTVDCTADDVNVIFTAVEGVADTYKLTVTFPADTLQIQGKITIEVKDNHNFTTSAEFGLKLTSSRMPRKPSDIEDGDWLKFPNGGGSGAFNGEYFGYNMKIENVDGTDGGVTVTTSHEYPLYWKTPLKLHDNDGIAFQLYKFARDGNQFTSSSCGDFFQMGLVWKNPTTLKQSNTLEATDHLGPGEGVYITNNGAVQGTWNFYNGGGNNNACGATSKYREATEQVEWGPNDTITFMLRGDAEAEAPREITVWVGDTKVYSFSTKIPSGTTGVYSYVGAGYPTDLASSWQNAVPAFRFARFPHE